MAMVTTMMSQVDLAGSGRAIVDGLNSSVGNQIDRRVGTVVNNNDARTQSVAAARRYPTISQELCTYQTFNILDWLTWVLAIAM